MKKTLLLLGFALALAACSNNRETVVQSQRGDTKINEGSVPVQANDAPGPETGVDIMQDMDAAGTPGVTNDTTGSTTSGALNDPTGTPGKAPANRTDTSAKPQPKP